MSKAEGVLLVVVLRSPVSGIRRIVLHFRERDFRLYRRSHSFEHLSDSKFRLLRKLFFEPLDFNDSMTTKYALGTGYPDTETTPKDKSMRLSREEFGDYLHRSVLPYQFPTESDGSSLEPPMNGADSESWDL